MNKPSLYPLKFFPQLLEKVWGGDQLATYLGKETVGTIGESWELSGVAEYISVVSNGALKESFLTTLIDNYGAELLGEKVVERFGTEFPLLFKFIDAKKDLSVQLHPDDDIAKQRHDSFGKTEMWYVLTTKPDARIILGFNTEMDSESYQQHLDAGTLTTVLKEEKVAPGDAYFIAPGTVHAIGAGVLLAEIQQTSNITYRIYDWDRPDVNGALRELHTDLAFDVIEFSDSDAKLSYEKELNRPNILCESPYFQTHFLQLDRELHRDLSQMDSFVVYMCVDGKALISGANISEEIKKGETLLIPASLTEISIETKDATLLEVYVP